MAQAFGRELMRLQREFDFPHILVDDARSSTCTEQQHLRKDSKSSASHR